MDREGFPEDVFAYLIQSQFIKMLAYQANMKDYNLRDHLSVYSVDRRWLRDPQNYADNMQDSEEIGLEEVSKDFIESQEGR